MDVLGMSGVDRTPKDWWETSSPPTCEVKLSEDQIKRSLEDAKKGLQLSYYVHELMGVKEAMELWCVSRSTVKRWCEENVVDAVKVSGRWMINKKQHKPLKQQGIKR